MNGNQNKLRISTTRDCGSIPRLITLKNTPDPELYKRDEICGFDLWQVKSDTIFDNVLITDDPKVVCKFGEDVWKSTLEGEKRMKEIQNEEEKKRRDLEAEENEDNKNDEDDEDADEEEHTHSDNNAHDEL